jgi:hypothetical protein
LLTQVSTLSAIALKSSNVETSVSCQGNPKPRAFNLYGSAVLSHRTVINSTSMNSDDLDAVPCDFDPQDPYYYLDFQREVHGVVYESEENALETILPKLRKVMALNVGGRGFIIVKEHADVPFAIKKLKDVMLSVSYYATDEDSAAEEHADEDADEEPPSKPKKPKKLKILRVTFEAFVKKHINEMPCYSRVVFKPNDVGLQPNEVNTWAKFKATRVEKVDMQPWLNHIRDVGASGNEHLYRYIMSWIKQILKHPERPSGNREIPDTELRRSMMTSSLFRNPGTLEHSHLRREAEGRDPVRSAII